MRVLCIGDVTGSVGCDFLRRHLPSLKRMKGVDVTVVNGENSADTNGITPDSAQRLFEAGADCITTGNHCYKRRESYDMFDGTLPVLRPANYPDSAPGRGVEIIDLGRARLRVINLMGLVGMSPTLDCPFRTMDRLLAEDDCRLTVVDFHAEATGEKRALAEYLKGRVSALFGTHTHVQTADEQILGGYTGFISDLGMTGPIDSCLGVKPELAIGFMKDRMPTRLDYADGPCVMGGVLFELDNATGACLSAERINIR